MKLFKNRIGLAARILQNLHDLPEADSQELHDVAQKASEGDNRPLLDFLKRIFTDPATLQLVEMLLPMIIKMFGAK